MTNHSFRIGDEVMVCHGSHSDVDGTVIRILPDPKGLGHDLITVRLRGNAHQMITVSLFPGDLRPARAEN